MSAVGEDWPPRAILETVRRASAQARLLTADAVVAELRQSGCGEDLATAADAQPCRSVAAILSELPDIASLASVSGHTVYHDTTVLSRTYARILDRKSATAVLLAEEIRSNSREYPRPVPLELFEKPPFDLSPEIVRVALEAMASCREFEDIASLTTSAGAVYLFSTLYLERDYAAFLAEQDASFVMNP